MYKTLRKITEFDFPVTKVLTSQRNIALLNGRLILENNRKTLNKPSWESILTEKNVTFITLQENMRIEDTVMTVLKI